MILGADRLQVIQNIKDRLLQGELNAKVEIGDPVLSPNEAREITNRYLKERSTLPFRFKSFLARMLANIGTFFINRNTEIVGDIDPEILKKGVIITSNHFSPLENTVIRHFVRKNGQKRLNIVSQVTNFAMGGVVGFLMNYADTIPLSPDMRYFTRELTAIIAEKLNNKETILIYPEQEMWFNYRKPRPHKEGAYHFASKLDCPIVSCFVEIIDKDKLDTPDFYKTKYRLHILGVLYPDENKTDKENRKEMCKRDYEMRASAYERIYGKKLDYKFNSSDIAGWIDYRWVYKNE